MIDGELYILEHNPRCVFAYKSCDDTHIYHYACVNASNEVKIPGIGMSTGRLSKGGTRLADDSERERFYIRLHSDGYHYNIANKKVIRISTGELI